MFFQRADLKCWYSHIKSAFFFFLYCVQSKANLVVESDLRLRDKTHGLISKSSKLVFGNCGVTTLQIGKVKLR